MTEKEGMCVCSRACVWYSACVCVCVCVIAYGGTPHTDILVCVLLLTSIDGFAPRPLSVPSAGLIAEHDAELYEHLMRVIHDMKVRKTEKE